MIRCLVVDDKPLAIDILTDYISKVPALTLVHATTNPLDALNFISQNPIDLLFLDIQMPQLNGLQIMKIMQGKCQVILTTAYSEYAMEGFENDAVDYLLKPISFERFYKAVQKAQKLITPPAVTPETILAEDHGNPFIFVKTEYKLLRIDINDILYIEGMQNYVTIHTLNEKVISLQNIKKMEEQLPSKQFIRVHKSYLVALNKIKSIERSRILIQDQLIPLGDAYREPFYNLISNSART